MLICLGVVFFGLFILFSVIW